MEASEKESVASGTAPRRIIFTFCNLLHDVRDEKRKPKPWSPNEFSHLAPKNFQISSPATSPVPIRGSGQAFMVIGPRIAANYGL